MNTLRFTRTKSRSLVVICFLMVRLATATADPYERTPVFGLPKKMPRNALISAYTPEMAAADQLLAKIFGGPGAVAAASSFEPAGLSNQYPLYRGDILGDNGHVLSGHLSHAMHLYGSFDGRGETSLYVPTGFTSHSGSPTPADAAVTFFYPRLGNFRNVTLAFILPTSQLLRKVNESESERSEGVADHMLSTNTLTSSSTVETRAFLLHQHVNVCE